MGDRVEITYVIGVEGSTGNSTGSLCHYCIRKNGKGTHINVSNFSGIPNKIGVYNDGYTGTGTTTGTTGKKVELKIDGKTVYREQFKCSTWNIQKGV